MTARQVRRLARERRTIGVMIRLYCRHHHGGRDLCADCSTLHDYACRRIDRCVFGTEKPTCANCPIHCYRRDRREAVRAVMRWAGPRMLLRHPLLAILHTLDGRVTPRGLTAAAARASRR